MKKIVFLFGILFLSVFFRFSEVLAEDIANNIEHNLDNNLENISSTEIEEIKTDINNTNDKSKLSLKDIFGDEQTFPFVAGFGNN